MQGEVFVKPHNIDSALMFINFCKTKRGRVVLAQAAAGIDAAAIDGASTVEAGDSVEANVESLLREGAQQLEDAFFAKAMTGKAKHRLREARVIYGPLGCR